MTHDISTVGFGRRVVAASWAALLVPYLVLALWVPFARAFATVGRIPIPWVVLASALAGVGLVFARPRLAGALPASLDRWLDRPSRAWVLAWALGSSLAAVLVLRIAVFLADPSLVGYSLAPTEPFLVRHSCLTAYVHGAILSFDPSANVYDMAFVESEAGSAPLPATAQRFAPFTLDAYGYPPPFLLLPRALVWLTPDFIVQRLWFGAGSLLLLAFACAAVAQTLGGEAERRVWLLAPIFMASPSVLAIVQVGNFHVAAAAICVLCWVALERRRDGQAGVLLAIATLAKIFPGLLGVLLLVQRRWRAVGATCLAALVLCGLSVALIGTKVWHDFLFDHLPNVQSGQALRFLAGSTREIAFNIAPFGIPFKLEALGLVDWGWAEARTFGNVYTLLLFGLAVIAGRQQGSPRHRLCVWIAIVFLASLRSPYAAPFVLSTMSLLLVVLAAEVRSRASLAAFVAFVLVVVVPIPSGDPRLAIVVSMVQMALLYATSVWLVVRRDRLGEADELRARTG